MEKKLICVKDCKPLTKNIEPKSYQVIIPKFLIKIFAIIAYNNTTRPQKYIFNIYSIKS